MQAPRKRGFVFSFVGNFAYVNKLNRRHLMLKVRDHNGFRPLSSIDQYYIRDTAEFAVYIDDYRICRFAKGTDSQVYDMKVHRADLFAAHLTWISRILVLYAEQ
jgi:hypothetical protein